MLSAPDTVVRNVLLSQHTGATAVVTADAQVPMITGTLSTSTSLCAARTAASGLVSVSSTTSRIGLPEQAAGVVDLVRHRLHRLQHARTVETAGAGQRREHAEIGGSGLRADGRPARRARRRRRPACARRVRRIMRSPLYGCSAGCAPRKIRRISGSARSAAASPSRLLRPSTRIVARCAISSASAAFCSTMAMAMPSRLISRMVAEQLLRRDRRQPGGGFVEQ